MVDKIMDVPRLELMQERYRHSTIGQGSEECHSPVCLVAATDCDLVALAKAAFLESKMHLRDASCHIAVCERNALVVGESRTVPVVTEALL